MIPATLRTWKISDPPPADVDLRARATFTCPHPGEKASIAAEFDPEDWPVTGSLTLNLCPSCRRDIEQALGLHHLSR